MIGTFFGLEIAKLALWANRRAMDVTGHNVANANTPGYTRQRVHLRAAPPVVLAGGGPAAAQLGAGVIVERIDSLRNAFLDRQVWSSRSELARWTAQRQALDRIEAILNEPTDNGIRGALDRWWDAWAEVAANPESMAARTLLLERSHTLVETFKDVDRRLAALQEDARADLTLRVQEVNALAKQIAALNDRIVAAETSGHPANDLRDQRALLVERLAEHIGVTVVETSRGTLRVNVGGTDLVGEHGVRELAVQPDPNTGAPKVVWAETGGDALVGSGGIAAALDLWSRLDPSLQGSYRAELLKMVVEFSTAVNNLHLDDTSTPRRTFTLAGQGGGNFFTVPTRVEDWDVAVLRPEDIAAGLTADPGDGENALAISRLKYTSIPGLGTTLDDYYRSWIARIGVASQEAARLEQHQQLLLTQVSNQRDQVTGVSLDEEMAAMLQYQHAYEAAARIMTSVDQMLETLIHRTGIAGR